MLKKLYFIQLAAIKSYNIVLRLQNVLKKGEYLPREYCDIVIFLQKLPNVTCDLYVMILYVSHVWLPHMKTFVTLLVHSTRTVPSCNVVVEYL